MKWHWDDALENGIPDAIEGFFMGGPIGAAAGLLGGGLYGGLSGNGGQGAQFLNMFKGTPATPANYAPSLATSGGGGDAGAMAQQSAVARMLRGMI